jgi:hypothetical protein
MSDQLVVQEDDLADKRPASRGALLALAEEVGAEMGRGTQNKHPKVQAWLSRHKRFHLHLTPTSASWLNAVEGFFAKLTRQRLRRGVFTGIVDLQAAINRFLRETNDNPKPFTWTADPDAIIEKVRRGKQVLESIH